MATIADVISALHVANTKGVTELAAKGVEVPSNEKTYNIMEKIADISGDGKKVKFIKAIDANTIQVIYEDDSTATIVLEYDDDGKIIKLNGVNAVYDGDNLVRFGSADIDIEEIPSNPPILPSGIAKASVQSLDKVLLVTTTVIKG